MWSVTVLDIVCIYYFTYFVRGFSDFTVLIAELHHVSSITIEFCEYYDSKVKVTKFFMSTLTLCAWGVLNHVTLELHKININKESVQ